MFNNTWKIEKSLLFLLNFHESLFSSLNFKARKITSHDFTNRTFYLTLGIRYFGSVQFGTSVLMEIRFLGK